MNRRRFLGLGLASAAAAAHTGRAWAADAAESFGLLVDLTRCMGCQACEVVCADTHGLPRPAVTPEGDREPASPLASFCPTTADRLVRIQRLHDPDGGGSVWARKACAHCLEPACAAACPTGALARSPAGPVLPTPERCRGCHRCAASCPLGVPKIEHGPHGPRITQCDLCAARLEAGQLPACAEVCPEGATTFGTRRALIEEARRRMAAEPDRYHGHIFGRRELGGLGVLTLSGVPFEALGFPAELGIQPARPQAGVGLLADLPWLAGAALLPLLGIDRALGAPPEGGEASPAARTRKKPRRQRGLRLIPTGLAAVAAALLAVVQLTGGQATPSADALPWSAWSSAWLTVSAALTVGAMAVVLTSTLAGVRSTVLITTTARAGLLGLLAHVLLPLVTPGAPWHTVDDTLGLPGGWAAGVAACAVLAVLLGRAPGRVDPGTRRKLLAAGALLAMLPALLHLDGAARLATLFDATGPPRAGIAGAATLTLAALLLGLAVPLLQALAPRGGSAGPRWAQSWPLTKAVATGLVALALLGCRPLLAAGGLAAVASPTGAAALLALLTATLLPAALLLVGAIRRAHGTLRAGALLAAAGGTWICAQPWLTASGGPGLPSLSELLGLVVTAALVVTIPAILPDSGNAREVAP